MSDDRDLLRLMSSCSATASWAVWGPRSRDPRRPFDAASDLGFPVNLEAGVLHARTVLLGLNPGDAAAQAGRPPWANFHTGPAHNDHFLAEAFRGTVHWGAYMTDLLTEVNSRSNELDGRAETLARDVGVLVRQLRLLEARDPLFVCIGTKTAAAFVRHESVLAEAVGVTAVRWLQVPHYSGANGCVHGGQPTTYRRLVHAAFAGAGQPC